MNCDFCDIVFTDSANGIAELTLHKILDHAREVNEQGS